MENDNRRDFRTSMYKLLDARLLQAQKIGNYVKGYIDGKETVEKFIKDYCVFSNTKYIIRSSNIKKTKETQMFKANVGMPTSHHTNSTGSGTRYGNTGK